MKFWFFLGRDTPGVNHENRNTLIHEKSPLCNNIRRKMSTGSETEQAPSSPLLAIPAQPLLQTWEEEADALNLHGNHRLLFSVLRGFHEFSLDQCQTLRNEGY